ncbi:hypothetical protein FHU35_12107 [Saccharopolyspora dendranthemae]|uniref:Uncharacterized protein n=1 Tax=Saccharopolyspora dendranthemae TaxID=1181886 RepID=A0A561U6Z8_9PSEU|nr:hypothetical protein FHU35_15388 [Saccharopolyspora dendranthemae]TWF95116.1 hypothetical protein FHU35_12107 [Saccharopolyspora dendranthemae]
MATKMLAPTIQFSNNNPRPQHTPTQRGGGVLSQTPNSGP